MRLVGYSLITAVVAVAQASVPVFAQTSTSSLTDEIVVTAQKRAKNIQDTGLTVSALGSEQIRALVLRTLPDVAKAVVNVELFEDYGGNGLPSWVIRGVGLQDYNANNTPTAAIYVDDVYQVSNVMGAVGLYDTQRVEVLKGPQGGLYGRNTSGGAVKLETRRAVLNELSGHARATYSSWDTWDIDSAVNLPLGETLALRVAANTQFSNDAWQTSLLDNRPYGEKDRWNARAWLVAEPAPGTRVQWKTYAGVDTSELNLGRSIGMYDLNGELCAPVLSGVRDDSRCHNLAGVAAAARGEPPVSPAVQEADGATSLSQSINRLDNEHAGTTLIIERQLDDWTLSSITNAESFSYGATMDFDGTPLEFGHNLASSEIRAWSQELRLASPADRRLAWIAGAVYSREDFAEDREFRARDSIVTPLGIGHLRYDQNTQAFALYGDLRYRLTDSWTLNGTLRYTDDRKEYRNGSFALPHFDAVFLDDLSADYRLDSKLMGNVGLDWRVRDDLLLYGSLSRGFKAGGFYGGFPLDPQAIAPYEEETVWALETGFKSTLHDALVLNGAAFYYQYQDVQGYVVRFSELIDQNLEQLTNQGDAEHFGLELELQWALTANLRLSASAAWLEARITDSDVLTLNIHGDPTPLTGRRPYAPRYSALASLQYQDTLANGFELSASLDANYRTDFGGHHSTPADRAVKQLDAYGVVNAAVFVTPPGSAWTLSVWGKNLNDKAYTPRVVFDSFGDFIDIPGQPRSAGLSLELQW